MEIKDILKEWEETEQKILEHLGPPDSIHLSELIQRSGLEVFEAIFSGELPSPTIGETLDYIPIRMELLSFKAGHNANITIH